MDKHSIKIFKCVHGLNGCWMDSFSLGWLSFEEHQAIMKPLLHPKRELTLSIIMHNKTQKENLNNQLLVYQEAVKNNLPREMLWIAQL